MPGSVAGAAPTAVLPRILATLFERSQEWTVDENVYRAGEVQRDVLVSTSRKRWSITRRLTVAQIDALRQFYLDRDGGNEEFYMYDPVETSPAMSDAGYDPTGAATAGRYAVRFEGPWRETLMLGRNEGSLELVEVS